MKKIFITLILMLSIFSIVNAHPFKTEKELYDYYTEIDKKINSIKYISGSIEDKEINRKIVEILEGTFPAFNLRECKYIK